MKIYITQYMRPDGRREELSVEVPDDVGLLARDQIISCEIVPGNTVAIYARRKDQDEDDEEIVIAQNCLDPSDPNSPTSKLIELIRLVADGGNISVETK